MDTGDMSRFHGQKEHNREMRMHFKYAINAPNAPPARDDRDSDKDAALPAK